MTVNICFTEKEKLDTKSCQRSLKDTIVLQSSTGTLSQELFKRLSKITWYLTNFWVCCKKSCNTCLKVRYSNSILRWKCFIIGSPMLSKSQELHLVIFEKLFYFSNQSIFQSIFLVCFTKMGFIPYPLVLSRTLRVETLSVYCWLFYIVT